MCAGSESHLCSALDRLVQFLPFGEDVVAGERAALSCSSRALTVNGDVCEQVRVGRAFLFPTAI